MFDINFFFLLQTVINCHTNYNKKKKKLVNFLTWKFIIQTLSLFSLFKTKFSSHYVRWCLESDGPAVVRINLFVRSIATISDIKMVSQVASANNITKLFSFRLSCPFFFIFSFELVLHVCVMIWTIFKNKNIKIENWIWA